MVDKNKKTSLKNQNGQALFELIIFIPFLIFLYTIYSTTGNAISASINQQKAVRGYFYSLLRGNSYVNSRADLKELSDENSIKMVGFSAIGWREKSEKGGKSAFAPCFRFSSLLKSSSTEECDQQDRDVDSQDRPISRFIRVFTFYGICGPVYSEVQDGSNEPFYHINPSAQTDPYKCALGTNPIN